jgi:hypothetical protein
MIGLLLSFFLSFAHGGWEFSSRNEASVQHTEEPVLSQNYNRARARSENDLSWTSDLTTVRAALGGWSENNEETNSELTQGYLGLSYDALSLKVGYQSVSWGQSFAFYVADLANPKDHRDPFVLEPQWINRSQFMVNLEYFFSGGGLQLVASPNPVNSRYAKANSRYDFLKEDFPGQKLGSVERNDPVYSDDSGEYGAKANYVFSNGFEIMGFGLQHWNRNPTYIWKIQDSELKLVPVEYLQQSYGLGFTIDLNKFAEGLVARADWVYHSRYPRSINKLTQVTLGLGYDFATAIDWTSANGLILGAQWLNHTDQVDEIDLITTRVSYKFWRDRLELSNLVTGGINTSDLWIQLHLTLSLYSHFQVVLGGDHINARSDDPVSLYRYWRDKDRYSLEGRLVF